MLRHGLWCTCALAIAASIGAFEDHQDIGDVLHPGSAEYDATSKSYTVTGSGENMWFGKDEFQFVWKKVSGDFVLTAGIDFPDAGGNAHKKAVLMARQTLDGDSVYADVAVHGSGLTSLQAREEAGANTHEVGIDAANPRIARLEKHGDFFYMSLAGADGEMKFSGASMRIPMKAPFYVGIGVCSHDKDAIAKAVFSKVSFTDRATGETAEGRSYWTTERVAVSSTDRRVLRVESPPPRDSSNNSEVYPASGEFVNCFPRPSPDGTQVAVLSYKPGTEGCPAGKEVLLRVISKADGKAKVLARFVGGPGTFSSSPWSDDGKSIEFVSRQMVPEK